MKGIEQNAFHQVVARIALDEGYDPQHTVSLLKSYSSAEFLCGAPPIWDGYIPESVWQRVCCYFNAQTHCPYRKVILAENKTFYKAKSTVFIGNKFTEKCIRDRVIAEHIPTAQRLYQYLNWTVRINKVEQSNLLLEGRNGSKIMIINTELHDHRGQSLYALCVPNDAVGGKTQKWQLAAFLTAYDVVECLKIDSNDLPRGVREICSQFEEYRAIQSDPRLLGIIKVQINTWDTRRKPARYGHMKCIQTGSGHKGKKHQSAEDRELLIGLSSFCTKVRRALDCPFTKVVPILSIFSKKNGKRRVEDFSVDYLLPVRIENNWVGVVYRDMDPVMALMDIYDVTNKALLCDPSFNVDGMGWFENWYTRLRIVPDDEFVDREQLGQFVDVF